MPGKPPTEVRGYGPPGALGLIAGAILTLAAAWPSAIYAFETGHVIEGPARAIDGDTIQVRAIKVRLTGVAAPELPGDRGLRSLATMRQILTGNTVRCALTGETTYDREVGTCWIGTDDIGALIIASGRARDCPRYSAGRYAALEPPQSKTLPLPPYCRTGREKGPKR